MIPCKFSRSELLADQILEVCPFDLMVTQAKQCPCKRREWMAYGGIDLRVIECSYPNKWNGEVIRDPASVRALLVGSKKIKVEGDFMSEQQVKPGPLWGGGIDIKVIGVCGEIWTGKTLFLQSIDADNTLYRDWELSSGTYNLIPPDRKINVQDVLSKKKLTKPIDKFKWWLDTTLSIPAGKYSVIADDTVGDVEQGLADYVASKHDEFGFRTKESFEKTGGIFWAAVRGELQDILIKITQICQTYAFASHMRDEWANGSRTGKREPQGKDTWMKLASAYFKLGRPVDAQGNKQEKPDGIVLKHRISREKRDANGAVVKDTNGDPVIISLLPPRLSPCTPGMIRKYIIEPPNYEKLKKSERAVEDALSDEEKLRLQAQIAADHARSAEAENKRLEQVAALKGAAVVEAAAKRFEGITDGPTPDAEAAPFEGTKTTQGTETKVEAPATAATAAETSEPNLPGKPYTRTQLIGCVNEFRNDLKIPDDIWARSLSKRGAPNLEGLTDAALDEVRATLWTKHTAWKLEQEKNA